MATLDSNKTYKSMCKKGFQEAENKGNDHKRIEFWYDGKLTRCRTKFSHNAEELNNYLIGEMAKQIALSRNEFIEFAKCTLSKEGYVTILKSKKLV